jgi:hypothetical protein
MWPLTNSDIKNTTRLEMLLREVLKESRQVLLQANVRKETHEQVSSSRLSRSANKNPSHRRMLKSFMIRSPARSAPNLSGLLMREFILFLPLTVSC